MSQPTETIAFAGRIGEVVHTTQPDGRVFEQYRRAPGTRLIFVSPEGKILFNQEFRRESGAVDLRLPGGKVCDTLEAYNELRGSGRDITAAAKTAAVQEARQEAGLAVEPADLELVTKANAGATVEWDLYYFLVRHYQTHNEGREVVEDEGADIKGHVWLTPADIQQAVAAGQMEEWRSVGVLLGKVLPELGR
ncbi:MAG TPA: hypothetical protein VLF67_04595 [Candidatus Saccharimonas sp.]|nr:hypothetical protein [Candidatus Saccharimonas sp.]